MKMKNLKNIFLLTGLFGSLLLSSCNNDDPIKLRQKAVRRLYKHGSVKIAVANSFDENQTKMWDGILLAQEKIEKENLCPVKIELIKCEDGGNAILGATKAYEIAADKQICAVIGHGYSDISLSNSLIYQYFGILHFNFISTIHTLTERNNPFVFSNMPTDIDFGDAAAELCERNGYKKVLIYYLENISGTSLSNRFELGCNKRGISIATRESYDVTTSPQDIERSIKRWKNNFAFDSVFLAGRMPGIKTVLDIARQNGVNVPFVGADPFDDPAFASQISFDEKGRLFCVSNYDEITHNDMFNAFNTTFREKFGYEADIEAAQAYDALIVLAKAIAKAGSAVPADISTALYNTTWDECVGPYIFQGNGAIYAHELTFKVFNDGKFSELPGAHEIVNTEE